MPVEASTTVTYPVNLLLAGRPVLVVGGGRVALRKVAGLRAAGADITVVAPAIEPGLLGDPMVRCLVRPYQPGEVAGYRLAVTCTDDPGVNAQVAADGEASGVWVNSADDRVNCQFLLPAVARRGPIQITVSTGGASPALASWLRRHLEHEIEARWLPALGLLSETRAELRARAGSSEHPGWAPALDDGLIDLVAAGDLAGARQRLRRELGLPPDATPSPDPGAERSLELDPS